MKLPESINPVSQEEIDEIPFGVKKKTLEDYIEEEKALRERVREAVNLVGEGPGVAVSFDESTSIAEIDVFADLAWHIASDEGFEIETKDIEDEETGVKTLFLRKRPIDKEEDEKKLSRMRVLRVIDEACPDGPLSPDSPEFWFEVESAGEDEERLGEELLAKWNEFCKAYMDKKGNLKLKDYPADWDKKIPCPDCGESLEWGKDIGFNNHRWAKCLNLECGFAVIE